MLSISKSLHQYLCVKVASEVSMMILFEKLMLLVRSCTYCYRVILNNTYLIEFNNISDLFLFCGSRFTFIKKKTRVALGDCRGKAIA